MATKPNPVEALKAQLLEQNPERTAEIETLIGVMQRAREDLKPCELTVTTQDGLIVQAVWMDDADL